MRYWATLDVSLANFALKSFNPLNVFFTSLQSFVTALSAAQGEHCEECVQHVTSLCVVWKVYVCLQRCEV